MAIGTLTDSVVAARPLLAVTVKVSLTGPVPADAARRAPLVGV